MAKIQKVRIKEELSESEKFYVGAHLEDHPEKIAATLKKPVYLVTRLIKEIAPQKEEYKPTPSAGLFVTKTEGKKGGITVMTGAASEDGDNKTSPRFILQRKIQRALEEGEIEKAGEYRLQLDNLPFDSNPDDRDKDCITSVRKKK